MNDIKINEIEKISIHIIQTAPAKWKSSESCYICEYKDSCKYSRWANDLEVHSIFDVTNCNKYKAGKECINQSFQNIEELKIWLNNVE